MTTLSITRNHGQSVHIGEAKVTVRRSGRRIVISIEAPREVPIIRTELLTPTETPEQRVGRLRETSPDATLENPFTGTDL